VMNTGRWYPTAITLPDGSVLVLSGSFLDPAQNAVANNVVPQIWSNGTFAGIAPIPDAAFDLYPRMHVASTGLVYMTSLVQTWTLDVSGAGRWTALPGVTRLNGLRDYAPSVLYDVDKVIFIGGGNPPTANAEIIDLGQAQPAWQATDPMNFPRRQHNATILPDGTVLVTGGTRAGGAVGTPEAFNNLDPGQPVHIAELWDPHTGHWTQLAAEATDRCYHSTAVLLPDGRVLSAGSGELVLDEGTPQQRQNDPQDTHLDAQVFSPPYLFKGPRPEMTSAPEAVRYGDTFEIGTAQPDDIGAVTVVRLSSVTHSFNAGQRINFLSFTVRGGSLQATAPAGPGACPPGHYMLFILNQQGVPSVAEIVQIFAPAGPAAPAPQAGQPRILSANAPGPAAEPHPDAFALRARMRNAATGTRVIVGIQATCPYGIAACWGGANEALRNLDGVRHVDPVPDGNRSTATVYLDDDGLPPLDRWDRQFRQMVHDTYLLRGAEVTLNGTVEAREGVIVLAGEGRRPPVTLTPLGPGRKIQWDPGAASPEPVRESEAAAYSTLLRSSQGPHADRVTVTGPLSQTQAGYLLQVRLVE
jgi:galactose oxidase